MLTDQPTAPPIPGYHLHEVIGTGASSIVWAAEDVDTGVQVAVKVMDPGRLHVGHLMELAARESAILAAVEHPHIVRLHRAHPLADGSVALVLDLADGGSLAALVGARGRLEPGEVVTVGTPLAQALDALHERGVIHGDLTPGNVLFCGAGRPLLSDFEAARFVGEGHPPVVPATAGFAAPEVLAGDLPTEAADIYGLGALIWFALTGRSPAAPALEGTLTPREPAELAPLLGAGFAPVVAAMLAADPHRRPTAAQAAVALYRAAAAQPVGLVGGGGVDPDLVLTHRVPGRSAPRPTPISAAQGNPRRSVQSAAHRSMARRRPSRRPPARHRAPQADRSWRTRLGCWATAFAPTRRRRWAWASLLALAAVALVTSGFVGVAAQARAPGPSLTSVEPTDPAGVLPADRVLGTVVAARARALIARSRVGLADSAAPASVQLASDLRLIADLESTDRRYVGLSFVVADAQWVSVSASSGVLRAVVARSGYQVVEPDGSRDTVEPDQGRSLAYHLVCGPEGWRIAEVTT